jgi:hypothetical protein
MKKVLLFTSLLLAGFSAFAQVPQKFSYQAVAVDANGNELKNTKLCIRSSINKNTFNGNAEWVEVHSDVTTDDFGLFTIEIGNGTPIGGSQGDFSLIKWGDAKYFLKTEMSLDQQCSNYIFVGTNQLLSVPYALYSEKSNISNTANTAIYADTSIFSTTANTAIYADTSIFSTTANTAIYADTTIFANTANNAYYADTTLFSITSNTSNFADSSSVAYNSYYANTATYTDTALYAYTTVYNINDNDADPTNELQTFSVNGSTISLSGSNSTIDLNTIDADHDPTNELQTFSVNGTTIKLSGSNSSIDLNEIDADHDPTNELQQLTFDDSTSMLGLSGTNITIDLSNLPGFNASGSDLDYPQGVGNAKYVFIPDAIKVPNDSILYIIASEDEMLFPGVGDNFGQHKTGPNLPLIKPGTQVKNCRCIGFFKPVDDAYVIPVMAVLKANQSNFYQVPFGKNLVIKSGLDISSPLTLNGFTISPFSTTFKALVIPSGIQVRNLGNDEMIITGYLINE